jgi:hypothetical protein
MNPIVEESLGYVDKAEICEDFVVVEDDDGVLKGEI